MEKVCNTIMLTYDEYRDMKLETAMAESKADDYWRLICEMRGGLQELYSMRGEDELVAKICSPLIDKAAL